MSLIFLFAVAKYAARSMDYNHERDVNGAEFKRNGGGRSVCRV